MTAHRTGTQGWRRATRVAPVLLLVAIVLAGCGRKVPLAPAQGASLPPKALNAARAPTTEELMQPTIEARPVREDELLKRSKEREDDPFNLPPPGN